VLLDGEAEERQQREGPGRQRPGAAAAPGGVGGGNEERAPIAPATASAKGKRLM